MTKSNIQGRGICARCGHEVGVMRNGFPRPHSARRVKGRTHNGQPKIRKAEDCPGAREFAESLGSLVGAA